jgi:hypothetical protein
MRYELARCDLLGVSVAIDAVLLLGFRVRIFDGHNASVAGCMGATNLDRFRQGIRSAKVNLFAILVVNRDLKLLGLHLVAPGREDIMLTGFGGNSEGGGKATPPTRLPLHFGLWIGGASRVGAQSDMHYQG